ncbi:MAG: ABC transporter permease [Bacteroidia bacterium]|nr:ABC transporter permease [Bacteroidia bacterium]
MVWGGLLIGVGAGYFFPVETDCMLCSPSWSGPWLGTDSLGRDILIRLWRGLALSIVVGFSSAGLSVGLGTAWGILLGSRGGWVDRLFSSFLQSVWVVPALLWATLLAFVGGRGFWTLLIAITLSTWTETARLIRLEARRIWQMPFMEAGRAIGFPFTYLIVRHMLPMLLPLLRVQFLQVFATAVLIEAGLGFVGLSLGPPHSSLGSLLFESINWLTHPQGQIQAIVSGLLLGGMIFAVYSHTGYGRRLVG